MLLAFRLAPLRACPATRSLRLAFRLAPCALPRVGFGACPQKPNFAISWFQLYDVFMRSARERVTKLPRSNIYSASAEEISSLFCDYLEGDASFPVLTISERPLEETARNALLKSLESFGYGPFACAFATLFPADAEAEGSDVPLDAQALFLLVEGLDPVCVVCADAVTADALGRAFRTHYDLDAAVRVFGRPAVAFRNLPQMLETEKGKQLAWHLLKSLPKR